MMTNRTNIQRKDLEAYAWPGGYPVMYIAREGYRDAETGNLEPSQYDRGEYVCCAKCARDTAKWPDIIIIAHFVHYEGAPEQCEYCSEFTDSAYGDPDAEVSDAQ